MDTSPKSITITATIVCPTGQVNGTWIGATTIAGIRIVGVPGNSPQGALKNLLAKMAGTGGTFQDPEATLAMELALAPADVQRAVNRNVDPEWQAAYDKARLELEQVQIPHDNNPH
jgi:hypothetical protein